MLQEELQATFSVLQKDLVEAASVAAIESDDAAREYATKVQKEVEARLEVAEKEKELYDAASSQRPGAAEHEEVIRAKEVFKAELQRRVSSEEGPTRTRTLNHIGIEPLGPPYAPTTLAAALTLPQPQNLHINRRRPRV